MKSKYFIKNIRAKCSCGCGQILFRDKYKINKFNFVQGHQNIGERSPFWKGGKFKIKSGYIMQLSKNHPKANRRGYVCEHILVMENIIGRYLIPGEIVHHVNGKKDDNRKENLVITNRSDHSHHHNYGIKKPNISIALKKAWNTTLSYRKMKPNFCDYCHKSFMEQRHKYRKNIFCSRECSRAHRISPL